MVSSRDPLELGGLDPAKIATAVENNKGKPRKEPTELDRQKEARLAQKESRLANNNKGAPTGPSTSIDRPPQQTAASSVEAKSALLDRLQNYRERFPDLKKRNNVSAKSTYDEIYDEVHYSEQQLGSRGGGNLGRVLLEGSLSALEYTSREIWNPLGLDLTGLGSVGRANYSETFEPLVDELMIRYSVGGYLSPEYRLVLAVGALMVTVHSANSGDPRVAAALHKMDQTVREPAGAKGL